ncbi:hypothetical protein OBBRIDRAFT_733898, partial [Obba rivulosa]
RLQVPLILGWAMTIHKAQGRTIDKVRVDVGSAFETGQGMNFVSHLTQTLMLRLRELLSHSIRGPLTS